MTSLDKSFERGACCGAVQAPLPSFAPVLGLTHLPLARESWGMMKRGASRVSFESPSLGSHVRSCITLSPNIVHSILVSNGM